MASFLKDEVHYGFGAFELSGIPDEMMIFAGMNDDFHQYTVEARFGVWSA
jgi:hypothetical protein